MKALCGKYSMMAGLAVLLAASAGSLARAATAPCAAPAPVLPPEMVAKARQATAWPTFCSIPPTPTDVRTAQGYKNAVVDVRLQGVRLVRRTAPDTFSLEGTEDFAAQAMRQAQPPPPMATPNEAPTAAFIAALKARATPPPPPRKR